MARMIPVLPLKTKSNAEKNVFEMFKNATMEGADKWVVFHSYRIANHKTQMEGELDFLVCIPDMGVVALEVKGGGIRLDERGWYSIDRHGNTNKIEHNPFQQVDNNIHSLAKHLKNEQISLDLFPDKPLRFYTYGVMFPDCNFQFEHENNEWQWRIFDKRDGENVVPYIKKLIGKARQLYKDKFGHEPLKPSLEDINVIVDYLKPSIKEITYKEWINIIESRQAKFIDEQLRYFNMFISHDRCLIEGLAGSGKTFIAIEAMKRFLANGERVAFFCYNSVFAKYLKKQFSYNEQYSFVGNLHEFMLSIIKEAKLNLKIPETDKDYFAAIKEIAPDSSVKFPIEVADSDDFWEVIVPDKTLEALEKKSIEYDVVIIDEAQDLLLEKYFKIIDKILKNGVNRGKWCLFADPNQDITKKGPKSKFPYKEAIQLILGEPKIDFSKSDYPLNINCRNSKKIGEELSKLNLGNHICLDEDADEPRVQYKKWHTIEDQKNELEKCLDNLLKNQKIKPSEITILSTYNPHEYPCWYEYSVLSQLSQSKYNLKEYKFPPTAITYSTISGFKGMENSCIILVDVTSYKNVNLLYTGISRARSILVIFESETAQKERKK